MADELITIVITGNSSSAVAAAERTSASLKGVGVAATQSAATSQVAARRMISAGTAMAGFGRSWTRNVSMPLAAVGAVSVKMAVDFHDAMGQLQNSAGAGRKEVQRMTKAVLELSASGRVMQGPQELAEALYQIESQGLRGSKALQALKASADLAAIGNSDLEDTTKAVATAMQTGIKGGGNLRLAIGTLNATVGAGRMRMEDLNAAMGTGFITSAAQVGISLSEVGAALAALTAQGIPAQAAATRLRMTFALMAAPSVKAKDALKEIGLSATDMAVAIRRDGLLAALGLLRDHLDGLSKVKQTQILTEAFGGARSGTTIMGLVSGLDDVGKRLDQIRDKSGEAGKTLRQEMQDPDFQIHAALAQVQSELVDLGTTLVPVVVPALRDLVGVIKDAAEFFEGLPQPMKEVAGGLTLVALGGGVLLRVLGGMLKGWGSMILTLNKASTSAGANVIANQALSTSYVQLAASIRSAAAAQGAFTATQSGLLVPGGARGGPAGKPTGSRAAKYLNRAGTGALLASTGMFAGSFVGGRGGDVLSGASAGAGVGMLAGPVGAAAGAAVGAMTAAIVSAGEGMGSKLAAGLVESFDENLRPKLNDALQRKDLGELAGLRRNLRRVIAAAVASGASDADLKPLRDRLNAVGSEMGRIQLPREMFQGGLDALRSGVVVRMGDIRKVFEENVREIGMGWKVGSNGWRKATATNLQATVQAIRTGMRKGVIATEVGQRQVKRLLGEMHLVKGDDPLKLARGFRSSWKRAEDINEGSINRIKRKLAQMPKDSREAASNAMLGMARQLERDGKLPQGSVDRLRSALVTRFGQTNKELSASLAGGVKGMGGILDRLGGFAEDSYGKLRTIAGREIGKTIRAQGRLKTSAKTDLPQATGSYKDFASESSTALTDLGSTFNSFLVAFKQKPINFTVSATGGGDTQERAEGGFFVPSSDRRDHVHAILGGQEAVVNIHQQPYVQLALGATAAMGLQPYGSLGELFSSVQRPNYLAAGGFAGKVPKHVLSPAMGLTAAGNNGLDRVREAGLEYVRKHARVIMGSDIVEVGRSMQKLGYEVGEHPAFGGVGGSHVSGSDHYANRAVDVNDDSPPYGHGNNEMSSLDWLAGQLQKLPHKQIIWRNRDWDTGASIPNHMDHLHLAMARGGFLGGIQRLAAGGFATKLVGASTYGGPADSTSGTVGAAGVSLPGKMAFAELDMGKALGGLPFHAKLKVARAGKSVIAEKLDIGAGGGPVGGRHRAIDLWYETANAIGLPDSWLGVVQVSAADGVDRGGRDKGEIPAEVTGKVKGGSTGRGGGTAAPGKVKVRTEKLESFGSLPDNIKACRRELEQRRHELARYRVAYREHRKEHPEIARAIEANINLLVARVAALRKQLNRLLRERRIKKMTARIAKMAEFSYWNDEQGGVLPRAERAYEKAAEFAEQVVALEPEEPANAIGDFAKTLTSYIQQQEAPAFAAVLDSEATWRNSILRAEAAGESKIGQWRGQITKLHENIEEIRALRTKKPAAYRRHAGKIPVMQAQMKALRGAITTTRGEVMPSWEDMLGQVQGFGGSREIIPVLPSMPEAGSFGGHIFETQMAIRELGLKVEQAQNAGSGTDSSTSDALAEAIAERNRIDARKGAIESNLAGVLAGFREEFGRHLPYVGAFADGGIVPGPLGAPGVAVVHGGETITPVGGGIVNLYLSGDLAKMVEASAPGMAKRSDRWIGRNSRRLTFAPGG